MARGGKKAAKGRYFQRIKELLFRPAPPCIVAGSFGAAFLCGTAPWFACVVLIPFLARLFRLNKALIVTVTVLLLANPFMVFVMFLQTIIGLFLMRQPVPAWLIEFRIANAKQILEGGAQLVIAYTIGGFAFCTALGLLVFLALWPLLVVRRKWRVAGEAGA